MANKSINEPEIDESESLLMSDDVDFIEENIEEEPQERVMRSKGFNVDMRHRIEEKLEERRLLKELNEYEFFDIDEDDMLH